MAPARFLRLRDKLLIAVTLLVVVLTAAVLYSLNERLQSESLTALNADLNRTASTFNSFVDDNTANLADKAFLISGLPRLTAALDVRRPKFDALRATVSELCLDLNGVVRAPLFLVTDKTGRILFDSHHVPEDILALREGRDPDPKKMEDQPDASAADWPNVKQALAGQFSKGALLYTYNPPSSSGEKPKLLAYQTVTFPISSRGNILGSVILGSALDKDLAGKMKNMTDSEIAFFIQKQVFGSTWDQSQDPQVAQALAPLAPPDSQWAKDTQSQPLPLVLDGENYLCLFAPLRDTQGQVLGDYVILRSLDKALALERNLQHSIVVIGILGVVFAFGIALFISQRITAPLNSLLKGVRQVGQGNLSVRVPVQTKDELGLLARAFNEMIVGLREKERVTNILGKYVSPEVAKKILESGEGVALKGERRECVIMFTDIRGFTAMSENMAPEKLVADLNEYFSLMVDVVLKYEGTLDKFIGDAIMAVWGAPVPFEDKELRGVQCALDMQAVLARYNMVRVQSNRPVLPMGIVINTGVVVSGNLGSDKRTDYTVIGEEVNLASRLCSKALPGQTLISESTYRKLKGLIDVKTLEPIPLKGFTEPVKIYEVTGMGLL